MEVTRVSSIGFAGSLEEQPGGSQGSLELECTATT